MLTFPAALLPHSYHITAIGIGSKGRGAKAPLLSNKILAPVIVATRE